MASIDRLSPLLAIAVGVLHAGLSPVISLAGAVPNLVLLASVILASWVGAVPALVVAFAGGLVASLYGGEPLGAVPLVTVVVTGLVAVGAGRVAPIAPVYAVGAVFVGSLVADRATTAVASVVAGGWPMAPLEVAIRAASLNATLAALVVAGAILLTRRRRPAVS